MEPVREQVLAPAGLAEEEDGRVRHGHALRLRDGALDQCVDVSDLEVVGHHAGFHFREIEQ